MSFLPSSAMRWPLPRVTTIVRSPAGLLSDLRSPGARTAWHTHPAGQVLIVTDGTGWIREDGSARREIRSGDVVSIAAGVRHWHGATSSTAMRHIAITNLQDGKGVDWLEQVTGAQYGK